MRDRPPRLLAATLFASLMFASTLPWPLRAQAAGEMSRLEDASTPPRGFLRFHPIVIWTRYDSRFTANGVEPLGARFTADSFGVAQLPTLITIQAGVEAATASPFTLSLGRSRVGAMAREEVIPLGLEYGITDWLAVGVTVPIVRKRISVQFRLDTAGGFVANVGPNLQRTSSAARQTNIDVQTEFAAAATALAGRIAACSADPSGSGCATVLAQGPPLLQESQGFAAILGDLYGSATSDGMAFVPIAVSTAQMAIGQRVADFNARYRTVLGASTDLLVTVPQGAGGPAGIANVQEYLVSDLGLDALTRQEWVGIGDVELGFKWRVVDIPRTERRRTGVRLALAGRFRFPTGSVQSFSDVADMRIGAGSGVAEVRTALDVRNGRFGLLATGAFATSVYDKDTTDLADRTSRWSELYVAPRWHLSDPFALHAAYSFRTTDQLGGDQLVGGGVSFSWFMDRRRLERALPMEARYTHLQAITGDAGLPKFYRDQLEMRVYFRLPGR